MFKYKLIADTNVEHVIVGLSKAPIFAIIIGMGYELLYYLTVLTSPAMSFSRVSLYSLPLLLSMVTQPTNEPTFSYSLIVKM